MASIFFCDARTSAPNIERVDSPRGTGVPEAPGTKLDGIISPLYCFCGTTRSDTQEQQQQQQHQEQACARRPLITKAEKGLVVRIRAQVKTASDAHLAAADPAVGLLALSGKIASIEATLNSFKKRCPTGAQRLRVQLAGVLHMWSTVKLVVRNRQRWACPRDQQEAFELMGLNLAECGRLLGLVETEKNGRSFWPDVRQDQHLVKSTTAFAVHCGLQGQLDPSQTQQQRNHNQKQQQRHQLSSSSRSTMTAKKNQTFRCPRSPGKGSSGGGGGGGGGNNSSSSSSSSGSTATLSDDTPRCWSSSSSLSTSSSSSVSLLSSTSSSFTFAMSTANVTVRQSTTARWEEMAENSNNNDIKTSPQDTTSSASTSTSASSSSRKEGMGLSRRRKRVPSASRKAKVSVSPGAAFVPYRSPARLAFPRGSSLRGSGAIASFKNVVLG